MEPLKVLIVDDEYLIRNLLRMRIDWQQQGMQIVGEASDAAEALEQVEQLHPDIVFTDIYMPKMDGIELSERILERYPNIKIVVVTGHDEFEYARQSVKLGISDFILKPIRASELLQVTAKLRASIEQERGREIELVKLREEMERSLPYLKERFVNQWLQGALHEEEVREQLRFFDVSIPSGMPESQVAVIEIDASVHPYVTEEIPIMLRLQGLQHVQAYYQENPHIIIVMDTHNRIVTLSIASQGSLVAQMELLQENLQHSLTLEGIAVQVTVGIGQRHAGWEGPVRRIERLVGRWNTRHLRGKIRSFASRIS